MNQDLPSRPLPPTSHLPGDALWDVDDPVGCTVEPDQPLRADQDVALNLLLPNQHESLPIELTHVRRANGKQAGIEFVRVELTSNLRLYSFVWDQKVQRAHTVQHHRATS